MDQLLCQLNQKQLEAVTSTEGFIRVIAGAGSGKPEHYLTDLPFWLTKLEFCQAISFVLLSQTKLLTK